MEVAVWLRSLGLERYEPAFRDNDVDGEVLATLTSEDLNALGVRRVGHRRKLLNAIAALPAAEQGPGTSGVEGGGRDKPGGGSAAYGPERRQLTVMFCDLVGSTALAARLDPEDTRDVIRAYQNAVVGEIVRFEGLVAKFMGDGVLAYFGWPRAHEEEAERAARAGLAVVAAVGRLFAPGGEPLRVRVGVATGLVVVGDLVGHGAARERAVVGETPNLAARLKSAAAPGEVLVSAATRRLLGTDFDLSPTGPLTLKGIPGPVLAFRVAGTSGVTSRFDAHHAGVPQPMVGRERELLRLLGCWRRARAAEGQCVVLMGEAGIGKSRVIRALRDAVEAEGAISIRHQCSPYHTDSALWPVTQQLAFAAGFAPTDDGAVRHGKLEALLREAMADVTEATPLVAALLGLDPAPGMAPAATDDLTPPQRRARTLQVLTDQLVGLAARRPVLYIVEDAHWIDPSTLELIELALDRIAASPVLIVVTARPGGAHGLAEHPLATRLTLTRLDRDAVAAIVDRVARGRALPAEVIDEVQDKTDGVPLFVEELTRAVLESGLLHEEAGAFVLDGPLPPLAIPSSLHDSLLTRLDRFPPVKEVAQMAACIGRTFAYPLLAAVAAMPEDRLRHALDQAGDAGLVFRRGTPPEASYTFKHALVRDAAHQSLLKSRREYLHHRIAEAMRELTPEVADAQPELLAVHYTAAGLAEPAIEFWRRAGARSIARYAHREATAHFGRALVLLERLPPGRGRDEREVALRLALAVALIAVHGFGSEAVWTCAGRAKTLCERLGAHPSRFAAHRVMWNSSLMREPVPRTVALARELMDLARTDGDPARLAAAHRAVGYSLQIAAEHAEANAHFAEGIALADRLEDDAFAVFGEHPGMVCRVYLGWGETLMGAVERGRDLARAALAHARARGDPHALAWALVCAGFTAKFRLDAEDAGGHAREALAVAREHRLPQWSAFALEILGWARFRLGERDGLAMQEEGLRGLHATGALLHTTRLRQSIAEHHLALGRLDTARFHIDAAHTHRAAFGEAYMAAELQRTEALLRQAEGAPEEEVLGHLAEARRIARAQDARLFELRAATAEARLRARLGDHTVACGLLAPLHAAFTEGLWCADIHEAQEALREIR